MSKLVLKTPNLDVAQAEIVVEDQTIPEPGPGQVIVKMALRPINPADIFTLMGGYPGAPFCEGQVPGLEGCGTIERVGAGTKLAVGQRVSVTGHSAAKGRGTWQTYVAADESDVVPVSDKIDDFMAATFFINPVTVYGMLKSLDAPKGAWLIQTASGSTLGRQFIQVAKHWGYRTINIVRRKEMEAELKELGADVVIDSTTEDVVARVREVTGGEMAHGGIECVMGELTGTVAACVRDEGSLLLYGAMAGFTFTVGVPDVLFRGVQLKGFWVMPYLAKLSEEQRQKAYAEVLELIGDRVITPYTGKVFPLVEFWDAIAEATKPARGGKAFLSE